MEIIGIDKTRGSSTGAINYRNYGSMTLGVDIADKCNSYMSFQLYNIHKRKIIYHYYSNSFIFREKKIRRWDILDLEE